MTKQLRRALVLAPIALIVPAAAALALKVGPIKGAVYVGAVHSEAIYLKVARSGKSAKASLPVAPGFCQGGSGPEEQRSTAAAIASSGRFTSTISYVARSTNRRFATVIVSGYFYGSVFQGTVKSSFTAAKSCDGQASFGAKARG
jgi:hypothetical protein